MTGNSVYYGLCLVVFLLDVSKGRRKLLWGTLPPLPHSQLPALSPPMWPSKPLAHLSTRRTSEQEGPGQASPPGHGSASSRRIWPAFARGSSKQRDVPQRWYSAHRDWNIYYLALIKCLPVLLVVRDEEIKVQTSKVPHSWSHRESVAGPGQSPQPCVPAGL